MSTSGPRHGPWERPRLDVGEVHVRGQLKFVSQMSIFRVVHAWTISKSTRGHLFPAGGSVASSKRLRDKNDFFSFFSLVSTHTYPSSFVRRVGERLGDLESPASKLSTACTGPFEKAEIRGSQLAT
jgi:hypothetical protein